MTPRAWLLFVLSSVIWGVPYLFIKIAVDDGVPPAFVAWSRVSLFRGRAVGPARMVRVVPCGGCAAAQPLSWAIPPARWPCRSC